MSREIRLKILSTLKWRLDKAIREERNSDWINLLTEEIEKHTTLLEEKK